MFLSDPKGLLNIPGVVVILAVLSLVFGITSFVKYSKTRKILYLFIGIILTLLLVLFVIIIYNLFKPALTY